MRFGGAARDDADEADGASQVSGEPSAAADSGLDDAAERIQQNRLREQAEAAAEAVREVLSSAISDATPFSAEEWESKRKEHDKLVLDGHKANNAGSAQGAMECFDAAARVFPKTSTFISALNMRLKLGGQHVNMCACGYQSVLRTRVHRAAQRLAARVRHVRALEPERADLGHHALKNTA